MVQTYKRQREMYVNEESKEKAIPAVLNGITLRNAANLFYRIQKKERKKTQRRRETSHQSTLLI
jgi:hypothetical protein